MKTISVQTRERCELIDISGEVRAAIRDSGVASGACIVYCPHTTAAITINENADPDVAGDLLIGLERVAPPGAAYRHAEGNSDAHIKSSLVGCSSHVPIEGGKPVLGTWQGVYFCEFDGPRRRKAYIQVLGG